MSEADESRTRSSNLSSAKLSEDKSKEYVVVAMVMEVGYESNHNDAELSSHLGHVKHIEAKRLNASKFAYLMEKIRSKLIQRSRTVQHSEVVSDQEFNSENHVAVDVIVADEDRRSKEISRAKRIVKGKIEKVGSS